LSYGHLSCSSLKTGGEENSLSFLAALPARYDPQGSFLQCGAGGGESNSSDNSKPMSISISLYLLSLI
jgi:hypothetical protein